MADRSTTVRLRAEVAGFIAGIRTAQRQVVDLTRQVEIDAIKQKQDWQTVGAGMAAVGAGIGLVGVAAVKTSMDFGSAMSAVKAATGEGAAAMDTLREAALKAGADTAFSATEAARGQVELAKAGVSTADILGGGLTGALDLAAAGQMDVADAAETAATAMAQFGLEGDQVSHIADLLAAGASKAQGEVSDMAAALRQSGLVADQAGLSLEETVAGLSAFAEKGLLGSDAGTSFKTMLQRLTPTSKESAELMGELGISAYDASGNFIGLAEFAGVLQDSMRDMSPEARNAAMSVIFGSDAVRAATVLYENGADGIRQWTQEVDQAGYASEVAGTLLDNLSGDLEALGGSIETALINLGSSGNGILRTLVQTATDAVNVFNGLPGPVQGAVAALGGLAGLGAGIGGGLLFLIPKVAEFRKAVKDLSEAGGLAGRAIDGVRGSARSLVSGGTMVAAIGLVSALAGEVERLAGFGPTDMSGLADEVERFLATGNTAGIDGLAGGFEGLAESLDKVADPSLYQSISGGFNQALDSALGLISLGNAPTTRWTEMREELAAWDRVLADLVSSGNGDQAALVMARINEVAEAQGVDLATLGNVLPNYTREVEIAGATAGDAAAGVDEFAGAQDEAARHTADVVSGLERQVQLMDSLLDPATAAIDANIAYKDAVAELEQVQSHLNDTNEDTRTTTEDVEKAQRSVRDRFIDLRRALAGLVDENGFVKVSAEEVNAVLEQFGLDAGVVDLTLSDLDEVLGLLEEIARTDPSVTVNVDTSSARAALRALSDDIERATGRRIGGGNTVGGGYLIGTSHTGGPITSDMTGWMPGLAPDERLRVLQVGEYVTPRGRDVVPMRGAAEAEMAKALARLGDNRRSVMGDVTIMANDRHQPSISEGVWQLRRLAVELS